MLKNFTIKVAFRYLKALYKPNTTLSIISWFSLIGITLGVATLIVVMSVMQGFDSQLSKRIIGLSGHITIHNTTSNKIINYDQLISKVKNLSPEIEEIYPVIEGQVMALTAKKASKAAFVKAMDLLDIEDKKIISNNITAGDLSLLQEPNHIILGDRLASFLGIKVGDKLSLVSPEISITAIGMIPTIKTYEVAGLFNVGMYDYDASTIMMNLRDAQLYFKYPNSVQTIEIMLRNANKLFELKKSLNEHLKNSDYFISDWQTRNENLFEALKVERNVMFLILSLIILIAAFNIISSLTIMVQDKSKAIATLRTMGASKSDIMVIFVICGWMVGLIGTLIGALMGLCFALNIESIRQLLMNITGVNLFNPVIYFLSKLPSEVNLYNILIICGMSLIISLLVTLFPSYKAASKNPALLLRYE